MATITRKQREVQARERLILDTARRMFIDAGLAGLNMDRVAEAVEYSKGTIYHHFSCKEDLVAALTLESAAVRQRMFDRAAAFPGRPRERIMAVGVADQLFVSLHPDHYATESLVSIDAILDKASPARREQLELLRKREMNALTAVARQAVAIGDLDADEPTVSSIAYGLWAMSRGHHGHRHCIVEHDDMRCLDLVAALWRNYQALLDGYGWRPLSHEHDYRATGRRIYEQVFPEEHGCLGAAPGRDGSAGARAARGEAGAVTG